MNSKNCNSCNKLKPLEAFYKFSKGYLGRRSICKLCKYERDTLRRRTRKGLVYKIYQNQVKSSKRRYMSLPDYTKDELYEWVKAQHNFETLYTSWVTSDYDKKLIPSIDRLEDSKPYMFSNIQLVTWSENDMKGRKSRPRKRTN